MTDNSRWIVYALLGALFAALVQITTKKALKVSEMDTATINVIRAVIMSLFFTAVIAYEVWISKARELVGAIDSSKRVALVWVFGSGLAASLSWFYGYKALKLSDVSKTYPLDKLSIVFAIILAVFFLGERPSGWNWAGIIVMILGAYLVTIPKGSDPTWLFSGQAK